MRHRIWRQSGRALMVSTALTLLAACGGGGGGGASSTSPPAATPNPELSLQITGTGSVQSLPTGINCTASCKATFTTDTQVTLTATPATGQSFSQWGGACAGSTSTCTVTMSQARTVSATFAAIVAQPNYNLAVTVSGNGTVSSAPAGISCGAPGCNANFAANAMVTLTATPGANQSFSGWSGACVGAGTCTVQMTQTRSVQAAFAAPPVSTTWRPAVLLETNNDFNIIDANVNTAIRVDTLVAVGPNGDAMVLWEQSDGAPNGSTRKAFFRRYTTGGWEAAAAIPGLSTDSNSVALVKGKLLMDSAGVTTWIRNDNMQTRRHTPGSGWGVPFSPAPAMANVHEVSSYAMDASGNIGLMVSGDDVFTTGNVYNIALNAGSSTWGTWARVDNATTGLKSRDSKVALSSNGTALAIWKERNPGDSYYSMKAARFSNGWGTPEAIESSSDSIMTEDAEPAVAIDAQGNGIAIWRQGSSLYYNMYRVGAGWAGAVAVDAGFFSSIQGGNIALAMAPDGRAVATWTSTAAGNFAALRSMQYHPATGWTAPETVDTYNTGRIMYMDDSGQTVMVYMPKLAAGTTNFDLVSRRLSHGGAWSAPTLLETGAGDIRRARFEMNRAGNGVAAWVQNDAANASVRNSLWSAVLQ